MEKTPKTYYVTKKRVQKYIEIVTVRLSKEGLKRALEIEIKNLSTPSDTNKNQLRFFKRVFAAL